MKRHIIFLPLALSLAGCSSMSNLLAFQDRAPAAEEMPVPVAAPVAQPAEPMAQWCQRVAAKARSDAAAGGFDAPTQDRMAAQTYRQCLTMERTG